MTISRTNLCTNPDCTTKTGYTTTSNCSLASTSSQLVATWTANSTTPQGINAQNTTFAPKSTPAGSVATVSADVLASKNTTVLFAAYLLDAGGATIAGTTGQTFTSVAANVRYRLSVTTPTASTAGSYVAMYCFMVANNGGSYGVTGDTLRMDYVQVEAGAYATPYFDGGTSATANKTYAWAGTANASASTESIILPTTTVQAMTDAPCPRVGVTVDGLGAGNTVYNLWRTSDGARTVVRGARNRSTVDSDYVIDYEAPLGRPVLYDIEVVTGTNYLAATFPDTATVTSSTWWIQDPLVPSSAIPLAVSQQDTAIPTLTAAAVKALAYAADINIIPILGSSLPVALMGTRQVASGVDFSMFTRAAEATTTLRNLIQQTPLLLVRTNGVRNDGVPGLAYFASAKPVEVPVTVAFGGTLTNWQLQGDLVAAPSLNVLVPIWTYGTVQALWATYQQAQTTLAGKTYLDVLKSPSGA